MNGIPKKETEVSDKYMVCSFNSIGFILI